MKNWLSIIIILIFLSLIVIFTPSIKEGKCFSYKEFRNYEINGVVIDKYKDMHEHSYPTIIIRNFKDSLIQSLNLEGDTSNTFSIVQVSDTILKNKNDDTLFIRNWDSSYKKRITFGCPTAL